MNNHFEHLFIKSHINAESRRNFIRNAALGVAGASISLASGQTIAAGPKETGEITLDGLMWTYVSAPLGKTGSHFLKPELAYSISVALRALSIDSLSLRANVPTEDELLRGDVKQLESMVVPKGINLFPRPKKSTSFSVGSVGGVPEDTSFFGICRPVLRLKASGNKAQFHLVNAECLFITSVRQLGSPQPNILSSATAASWLTQYVSDSSQLVEPRFVFLQALDSGAHTLTMRARNDQPDLSATVTARIIAQSGFTTDKLKQAFAVGADIAVTYSSATDSHGKIVTSTLDLNDAVPGPSRVFWDRVFKTFVITQ